MALVVVSLMSSDRGAVVAGFAGWSAEDLAAETGSTEEQARRLLWAAVDRGEVAALVVGSTTLFARVHGGAIALVPPQIDPRRQPDNEGKTS